MFTWWEDIAYWGPLLDRPRPVTLSSPINSTSTRTLPANLRHMRRSHHRMSIMHLHIGVQYKLTFVSRTIPDIENTLQNTESLFNENDPQHPRRGSTICNRTFSFVPTAPQRWAEYLFTRRQEKQTAVVKIFYFSSRCRGFNHQRSEATLNSKHDKEPEAKHSRN